jgi:hypothetical protein
MYRINTVKQMNNIEICIIVYGTLGFLLQGAHVHILLSEIKKLKEILDDRERIL